MGDVHNKVVSSEALSTYRNDIDSKIQRAAHICSIFKRKSSIINLMHQEIRKSIEESNLEQLYDYEHLSFGKNADNELVIFTMGQNYIKENILAESLTQYSVLDQIRMLTEMEEQIESHPWKVIIPGDNIVYFQEKGDISYSTSVEGGQITSKGVSVGGAMAGKLLFGNMGALIGSQVGTGIKSEGISSTINEHDNRYVVLRYTDEDGKMQETSFEYGVFEILNALFPEKEYSFVSMHKASAPQPASEPQQKGMQGDELIEQLKKLKELVDMGILTEEEFAAKKKQVLGI